MKSFEPRSINILRDIIKKAVNCHIDSITFEPYEKNYKVRWRRGSRSTSPIILKLNKEDGDNILQYICETSDLAPLNSNSEAPSNQFEKPFTMDFDENNFSTWSAFVMYGAYGGIIRLSRVFPTALESWSDLGFTANQISTLKESSKRKGGVILFNRIYSGYVAHTVSWLSVQMLSSNRPPQDITHLAEAFFYPDNIHTNHKIEPGEIKQIFEVFAHLTGSALVIEPVTKNSPGIGISHYFRLAQANRLVVFNNSDVDLEYTLGRIKKLPVDEINKLALIAHLDEEATDCAFHDATDILENFKLDKSIGSYCEICNDSGTSSVEYKVTLLQMNEEKLQALHAADSSANFIEFAREKGWFIG